MVFYSSHPDGFALFMLAVLFLFHMHLCTIINNRRGLSTCKNGKAAHSLVMLPPSWAVLYCCFSIFVWVLRWRLDWDQNQLSIDRPRVASWLWSLPNMIAWIERCFFGFLDSPGVFCACYDWYSWLDFLLLACCQSLPCPISILWAWNGRFTFVWMGQHGMGSPYFFPASVGIT